jgi:ABC-type transporter Mla MlaB component
VSAGETLLVDPASAPAAPGTIGCDEALEVTGARAFKARLEAALDSAGPLVIEAARLRRVDGAGLQLLVAFVREVNARGRVVTWASPSAELQAAAALLGLSAALALGTPHS